MKAGRFSPRLASLKCLTRSIGCSMASLIPLLHRLSCNLDETSSSSESVGFPFRSSNTARRTLYRWRIFSDFFTRDTMQPKVILFLILSSTFDISNFGLCHIFFGYFLRPSEPKYVRRNLPHLYFFCPLGNTISSEMAINVFKWIMA